MSKQHVLILGARSDIGEAAAQHYAAKGYAIALAARGADSLKALTADLQLRHKAEVSVHDFDVLDYGAHEAFIAALPALPDIAICVIGLMGEQIENEQDMEKARTVMRSNYEGPANIFALLANAFAQRGSGTLVGVSSVAGERGRASNYVYGSAKAGFTAFLSGLRNRMTREAKDVQVVSIIPGFVDTQMTEGMDLPGPLTAQPDEVAKAIDQAVEKGRDVVYVRPIWRLIMLIIRHIPERIFKKLGL